MTALRLGGNIAEMCFLRNNVSRAFKALAEGKVPDALHATMLKKNYTGKLLGHTGIDSASIIEREKSCCKNTSRRSSSKKVWAEQLGSHSGDHIQFALRYN